MVKLICLIIIHIELTGSKKQQSDEQVKKVKSEYEKKITMMQSELSKVNAAKKEHAKMMKNQAVYDKRIKDLSVELNDMKKIKVRVRYTRSFVFYVRFQCKIHVCN